METIHGNLYLFKVERKLLASPYRLSANTNSILNPNSTNSVIIIDASSIFVLYLSSGFSVPFGLNILNIKGKVTFS